MRICFCAEDVAPVALGTMWHEDADFSRVLGSPAGGGGGSSSSDVPESSVANSSVLEGDGGASLAVVLCDSSARVAFPEFRCEEVSFGVSVRRDKDQACLCGSASVLKIWRLWLWVRC